MPIDQATDLAHSSPVAVSPVDCPSAVAQPSTSADPATVTATGEQFQLDTVLHALTQLTLALQPHVQSGVTQAPVSLSSNVLLPPHGTATANDNDLGGDTDAWDHNTPTNNTAIGNPDSPKPPSGGASGVDYSHFPVPPPGLFPAYDLTCQFAVAQAMAASEPPMDDMFDFPSEYQGPPYCEYVTGQRRLMPNCEPLSASGDEHRSGTPPCYYQYLQRESAAIWRANARRDGSACHHPQHAYSQADQPPRDPRRVSHRTSSIWKGR